MKENSNKRKLTPVAIFALVNLHAPITSMSPHLLASANHAEVTFFEHIIETMPLAAMMWHTQDLFACGFVSQDGVVKKCIKHQFTVKLMTEA